MRGAAHGRDRGLGPVLHGRVIAGALLALALLAVALLSGLGLRARAQAPATSVPPRPPVGDAEQRARALFDAIVHDEPARAEGFFFPRAAFVQVKAMAHPERYYDKLHARFEQDIHALHASTPDWSGAVFERLELVERGGYVRVNEEGNRLPYWASRHSWLHYVLNGKPRKLELRVLITWQERWYVIHLSEFR